MSTSHGHGDWHKIKACFLVLSKKKSSVRIPFANPKHASIAKQVIEVDQELQPHAVIRELTLDGDVLLATFYTLTVRLARLTLNSFLENVDLVVRTIGQFADDAEASQSHPSA